MRQKKGFVYVYTGDGKGKTTAAVGLTLRACAHGLSGCFVSFHKNPEALGKSEHDLLKQNGIHVFCFAKQHPLCNTAVDHDKLRESCLKGIAFIRNLFKEDQYDLVVLDEINVALRDGFLTESEILELLQERMPSVSVVLTGRGATEKIIAYADVVSEIRSLKHPFGSGSEARPGFDY